MKWSLIILIVSFTMNTIIAQDCDNVLVKGKVVDTLQAQGFYNLMVVNTSTDRGVFGRPNGKFSVYANNGDTIALSTEGYYKTLFIVEADSNCQFLKDFIINGIIQESETVVIYPQKTLKQIKEEREELSMRETRTVTGVNIIQSPITALYERFSKTAKSKRLVAAMEYQDNINAVLKELLRVYVSQDVVALDEKYLEGFINFLNIDEAFLKTATDYELIIFIKGKLDHFEYLNPALFEDKLDEDANSEEIEEDKIGQKKE